MQHRWIVSLAVASALAAPVLVQASDLRVSVSSVRNSALASQDVDVTVKYTNAGKQTLYVAKNYLPGKALQQPMFEVTRDGVAVDYLGALVKRRSLGASDMVAVLPGQSVSTTVKVSSVYDMSQSGNYSIRFKADSDRVMNRTPRVTMNESIQSVGAAVDSEELASNDVSLFVEGRATALTRQAEEGRKLFAVIQNATASSVSYGANCSASQKTAIAGGVTAASAYANNSTTYLNGTPSGTARYVTWFGKFSTTNWNTAKTHYTNIKGALDTKPLVFDCGCADVAAADRASTFAYVFPTQPYKIYLCGAFWNAPQSGTDSRGGTLVHELSHFNVIAGTQDNVYGQTGAKALAKSSPTKALNNADSHEYFAENNPFQN